MRVGHHGFELVEPMCYRYKLWSQITLFKIQCQACQGFFYSLMQKDRHLGSVKFAYLQWSRCTCFDVTSASPMFGFTSLASLLTYIAWASPVFGFRTRCFLLTERGSHGHHQQEICHELQRAPLDGAALFCPSLPSEGSEFFKHRTYTNPLQDISCYHEVPCKICSSPAQQTQVLNELCFAASQGTCLATFQCVEGLYVDVMTLHNCCPHREVILNPRRLRWKY